MAQASDRKTTRRGAKKAACGLKIAAFDPIWKGPGAKKRRSKRGPGIAARGHRPANFCPVGSVNWHRLRVNFHRLGIANLHRLRSVQCPGIAAR